MSWIALGHVESSQYVISHSVTSDSLWPFGQFPPDSSVLGTFQARILEWVAISSSRGSSRPRDGIQISCVSCIAGGLWTTDQGSPHDCFYNMKIVPFSPLLSGLCNPQPPAPAATNLFSVPNELDILFFNIFKDSTFKWGLIFASFLTFHLA